MELSINYIGCQGADTLQDSHSRDREVLVGIPIYNVQELDDLKESFLDDLNSCAQGDSFPWEEVKTEAIAFFTKKNLNLNAFKQDWEIFGEDEDENEIYLQWWFLITYSNEDADDDEL